MELKEIIPIVERKAEEIAKQEIAKYNKEFPELNLTEENAVENITIPFHKGAAAYYQDKGIKVNQKS